MAEGKRVGLEQCGRRISEEEVEHIRETVRMFPQLSLKELASTIGEHLEWYTAGGTAKRDACLKLLLKLDAGGVVRLSERQKERSWSRAARLIEFTERTEAGERIEGTLGELGGVELKRADDREEKRLWNEYVQRYHPLGYKRPFGYRLRYFICSRRGRLGCVLLSGAAKSLGVRDRWIGWSERARILNLSWVTGNNRYLVFPWVSVRNLASHVLAQLVRRVREDWYGQWGYSPVLMESFVDPAHHAGSCYKAAGWQHLGMTTGEGLVRPGAEYTTSGKMIFVKPLQEDFRELLCSEQLLQSHGRRVD